MVLKVALRFVPTSVKAAMAATDCDCRGPSGEGRFCAIAVRSSFGATRPARSLRLSLRQADADALPFADESFDYVLS
jgi:hypothetical protein